MLSLTKYAEIKKIICYNTSNKQTDGKYTQHSDYVQGGESLHVTE